MGEQLERAELIRIAESLQKLAVQLGEQAEQHAGDKAACEDLSELVEKLKNLDDSGAPLVAISGPAGLVGTSARNIVLGAATTIDIVSGEATSLSSGETTSLRSVQSMSLFVNEGGIKVTAASGKVDLQAQDDQLQLLAKKVVEITYILIDTTLIGDPSRKPWIKKRTRPSWIAALYMRPAIDVSPILIDIERSITCNRLDSVMELVNSTFPQLGISFIETELTLAQLQEHLCQFIFVVAEDGTELTLRFADCAVLPALSKCLTGEQWSCLVAPFESWKIHGRDGKLNSLPVVKASNALTLPLCLSNGQLASLKDAMAADQLLANLRKLRPGHSSTYSTSKAYECAQQIRDIWIAAGHHEDTDLLLFARDVFATDGHLLHLPFLTNVLAQPDPTVRRTDLARLTNLHLSKG